MRHLTFVLFLLTAAPVFAQVHPCDEIEVTTASVTSSDQIIIEFCALVSDNITKMNFYVNGANWSDGAIVRITPEVSLKGQALYRSIVWGPLARGIYTVEISSYNLDSSGVAQEGPRSSPFTLSVVDPAGIPVPAAPRINIIKKP